jgi:hypothetical protein
MLARTRSTLGILLVAALPTEALAQDTRVPPITERIKLSGPRFGLTYLGGSIVDSLAANGIDVAPVITQFGWQFERLMFTSDNGLSAVTEWVVLVGGLEQSVFLPSVSWLVGLRSARGAEFGVGPNVSAAGAALAIAAGFTTRAGALNLPVNVAVVPSKIGTRVSLLVGFTTRSANGYRTEPVTAPRGLPRFRPEFPPFPRPGLAPGRCCRASP